MDTQEKKYVMILLFGLITTLTYGLKETFIIVYVMRMLTYFLGIHSLGGTILQIPVLWTP